jgi:undecaprenyl-diphosphatase
MLVLALAVLGALLVFTLIASQVSSGHTKGFDETVLTMLRRADDPSVTIGPSWVEGTALELTALGSAGVLAAVVIAVVGYLAIERRFALLIVTLVATMGGWTLSYFLKEIFARHRPTVVPHLQHASSPSFPSGHAMLSAVVYLTLGVLLARSTKDRRLRVYFVATAMILTFIVGMTRMFLGVHYPTDVVGGWVAGSFWALLCAFVERALERRGVDPTVPAPTGSISAGSDGS